MIALSENCYCSFSFTFPSFVCTRFPFYCPKSYYNKSLLLLRMVWRCFYCCYCVCAFLLLPQNYCTIFRRFSIFVEEALKNWVETQPVYTLTQRTTVSQLHTKLFSSVSMLNFLHCRYFTSCRRHCQQHQQWFSWLVQLDGRLHVFVHSSVYVPRFYILFPNLYQDNQWICIRLCIRVFICLCADTLDVENNAFQK